jgi:hypothetical protein
MTAYHSAQPGAIAMGALCALCVAANLVDSAWTTAPTLYHGLALGALAITIAAGHMCLAAIRGWQPLRAAGLCVVFLAGLSFTMVTTAGRKAMEQQAAQSQAAAEAGVRDRLLAGRRQAEARRIAADADLADARRRHTQECASGPGSRCRGAARSAGLLDTAARDAAADVAAIDTRLAALAPAATANGELVAAADLVHAVTGRDRSAVLATLTVAWPYVLPGLFEAGSIIFLTIGLGHGRRPAASPVPAAGDTAQTSFAWVAPSPVDPLPPVPPQPPRRRRHSEGPAERQAKVRDFSAAYERRHGAAPSVREIARGCGIPRTSVNRYQQSMRRAA